MAKIGRAGLPLDKRQQVREPRKTRQVDQLDRADDRLTGGIDLLDLPALR